MDDTRLLYTPDTSNDLAADTGAGLPDMARAIDAFVDRMEGLAAASERRRSPVSTPHEVIVGARHKVPVRQPDGPDGDGRPRIDLVLYTSAASEQSQRAVRAVRQVLADYVASQVQFKTCDLSVQPQAGDADAVVFTPTLVKQGPGPRTAIIGNLNQEEILRDLLEASGVERRRFDE